MGLRSRTLFHVSVSEFGYADKNGTLSYLIRMHGIRTSFGKIPGVKDTTS